MNLEHRNLIVPTMKISGIGVEVGVQRGHFAMHLLKGAKWDKLYLVDPWKNYPPEEYSDYKHYDQAKYDEVAEKVINKFKKYPNVQVLRQESLEAVARFEDGSLDFVFIDANHAYDYVKADLIAWIPKIKKGGWIAGHDICYAPVRKAVDEILGEGSYFVTTEQRLAKSYFKQL